MPSLLEAIEFHCSIPAEVRSVKTVVADAGAEADKKLATTDKAMAAGSAQAENFLRDWLDTKALSLGLVKA